MTETLPLIHMVSMWQRDVSLCLKSQSCSPSTNTRKRLCSQRISSCKHTFTQAGQKLQPATGGVGGHPQPSGYLERLVFNEGEEGDISFGVPPGSRHAGSADYLPIPEADAELQRHVGWRFPRSSATTGQGNIEPDGGQISHTRQYKINF